jgi:molybdenum cofactor cytidylyltransferase
MNGIETGLGRLTLRGGSNLPPKLELQIADCRLQIEKKEFQSAICNLQSAIPPSEADHQASSPLTFQVMMQETAIVSAIVLAAGRSLRMGRNKLLLPYRGKTIIEHTVDALVASRAGEVIVVLGHEGAQVQRRLAGRSVRFVENADYRQGMSRSIQTGLRQVSAAAEGILISLGDQPLVEPEEVDQLIDAFFRTGRLIIAPVFRGQRGNPVILHVAFRNEILALEGDVGCREILARHPDDIGLVPMTTDHVLRDIDELEDYQRLDESMK